jgi:hypothetical protein
LPLRAPHPPFLRVGSVPTLPLHAAPRVPHPSSRESHGHQELSRVNKVLRVRSLTFAFACAHLALEGGCPSCFCSRPPLPGPQRTPLLPALGWLQAGSFCSTALPPPVSKPPPKAPASPASGGSRAVGAPHRPAPVAAPRRYGASAIPGVFLRSRRSPAA